MNLHQLRLFCTVADKGGFSAASRDLCISQPALSAQLKRLEQSVGLTLFRRIRGGVRLTEGGTQLYALASALLDHVDAVERRVEELRTGTVDSLVVGATPTSAVYYLTSALKVFAERYPDVRVSVRVDLAQHIYQSLRHKRLDAALHWGPNTPPGISCIPVKDVRFFAVISPTHPLANASHLTLEQMACTPFISLQHGLGLPTEIEMVLMRMGLRLNVIMSLPSIDAVKRVVEAGLGITMLTEHSIEREVALGALRALPVAGLTLERDLVALVPGDTHSPLVDELVTMVRATVR